MPIRNLALSFVLFASVVSAPGQNKDKSASSRSYDDPVAYEVYSVVLSSKWPIDKEHPRNLVISAETSPYKMCLEPDVDWEKVVGPAIDSYKQAAKEQQTILEMFTLPMPYRIVDKDEVETVFSTGGWEGFYRSFPDSTGLIELSAVGFNSDKSVAVVYVGHSCGRLCGLGEFHVLQKKDGQWMPLAWKGAGCSWVS